MRTKYATARTILWFVGIVGWIILSIGALLFLIGIVQMLGTRPGAAAGIGSLAAGVSGMMSGLLFIVVAHVAVALLDTGDEARNTNMILDKIARAQGVDLTPINGEKSGSKVTSELESEATVSNQDEGEREFMGEKIVKENGRWHWRGKSFQTLGKAKDAIKKEKAL